MIITQSERKNGEKDIELSKTFVDHEWFCRLLLPTRKDNVPL